MSLETSINKFSAESVIDYIRQDFLLKQQLSISSIKEVSPFSGHTNKVFQLMLENGQSLIFKIATNKWAGPRFESARKASHIIRKESDIVVPEYLPFDTKTIDKPVQIYWYITLPVLNKKWNELNIKSQRNVVRSIGKLLRSLHQIKVKEYGPLNDEDYSSESFIHFYQYDLQMRLRPAVWSKWKAALPIIDQLTKKAEELPKTEEPPTLVHNDVHLDNLFCKTKKGSSNCVGFLDLESAGGGRFEADIASAVTLHDPVFSGRTEGNIWLKDFEQYLLEGYDKVSNPDVLTFYKIYHLLNMGYYSAYKGNATHADILARRLEQLMMKF